VKYLVWHGDGQFSVGAQYRAHRVHPLDGAGSHAAAAAGQNLHPVAHHERLAQELHERLRKSCHGRHWLAILCEPSMAATRRHDLHTNARHERLAQELRGEK